jgi:hypothetical protein
MSSRSEILLNLLLFSRFFTFSFQNLQAFNLIFKIAFCFIFFFGEWLT